MSDVDLHCQHQTKVRSPKPYFLFKKCFKSHVSAISFSGVCDPIFPDLSLLFSLLSLSVYYLPLSRSLSLSTLFSFPTIFFPSFPRSLFFSRSFSLNLFIPVTDLSLLLSSEAAGTGVRDILTSDLIITCNIFIILKTFTPSRTTSDPIAV